MARPAAIVQALKANPGRSFAPSTPGMSRISPALAEMMTPGGSYSAAYGQFLPAQARCSPTAHLLLPARFTPLPLTSLSILAGCQVPGGGNTGSAGTCPLPLVLKA